MSARTRSKTSRLLVGELLGMHKPGSVPGTVSFLAESIHHGLYEINFADIYPFLNLDETLAFAGGSWLWRQFDHEGFAADVKSATLHGLFQEVYRRPVDAGAYSRPQWFRNPFEWLFFNRQISEKNERLYARLNPHMPKTLSDRLGEVPDAVSQRLFKELSLDVNEYVFGAEFRHDARSTPGLDRARRTGRRAVEMTSFHDVFPRAGKITPAYVNEINRILREYPTDIHSVSGTPPTPPSGTPPSGQMKLF